MTANLLWLPNRSGSCTQSGEDLCTKRQTKTHDGALTAVLVELAKLFSGNFSYGPWCCPLASKEPSATANSERLHNALFNSDLFAAIILIAAMGYGTASIYSPCVRMHIAFVTNYKEGFSQIILLLNFGGSHAASTTIGDDSGIEHTCTQALHPVTANICPSAHSPFTGKHRTPKNQVHMSGTSCIEHVSKCTHPVLAVTRKDTWEGGWEKNGTKHLRFFAQYVETCPTLAPHPQPPVPPHEHCTMAGRFSTYKFIYTHDWMNI